MKRFICSFVAIFFIVIAMVMPVLAEEATTAINPPDTPNRWQLLNVADTSVSLGNNTSVALLIWGREGSIITNVKAILRKTSGSDAGIVYSWLGLSSSDDMLFFYDTVNTPNLTSGSYRLTVTITLQKDGRSETVPVFHDANYTAQSTQDSTATF